MKWKNIETPQVKTSSFCISYVLNKSLNLKVKGVRGGIYPQQKKRHMFGKDLKVYVVYSLVILINCLP
jgi:hypothetical protein